MKKNYRNPCDTSLLKRITVKLTFHKRHFTYSRACLYGETLNSITLPSPALVPRSDGQLIFQLNKSV